MERARKKLLRKSATAAVLALAVVSSLPALTHDELREPVVKFIDFYIAAQQADVPPMSLWERVVYGLAFAKTPDKQPVAPRTPALDCSFPAD